MLERIAHSPLVGRARELAEAHAVLQRMLAGEGHALLLSGEPGIGKTRLVREVVVRSQQAGAQSFVCECYAEAGAPYAPIAQFLREAFGRPDALPLPDFVLADLITLAPSLRARFPVLAPNPLLDPRSEQERLYESAVEFCAALTERSPVLLVVEDVHWADGGTLQLLRHLARRLPRLRLLLVLTYREAELLENAALGRVRLDLNRERLATQLTLPPLSSEQTRDLLAGLFGGEVPRPFCDRLHQQTEGNPYFIEEVVKGLLDDGSLYLSGEHWHWPAPDQIRIPSSVRVAIRARVERLPAAVQETLRLAAMLGREFDFDLLRTVSGLDEDTLIDTLETAARARLIQESPREGRTTAIFSHALIPSALREEISAPRRQRLHRQIGSAIERLYPNDDEALAHHFSGAGVRAKAIHYARNAARRAESAYAFEAAIQYLTNALDWLKHGDDTETHIAVLEQLGDIYHLQGEHGSLSGPLFRQAIALSPIPSDEHEMRAVRLRRKFAASVLNLNSAAEFQRLEDDARAQLESAWQIAANEPPHAETVYLLTTLSLAVWVRQSTVDWDAAERYAREAIAMASQLDDPVVMSVAIDTLAHILGARGLLRERLQMAQDRLALSRDARFADSREQIRGLLQLGSALAYVGDFKDALRYLREAQALANQIRAHDLQIPILSSLSLCWLRLDRWDDMLETEPVLRALRQRRQVTLPTACWNLALYACAYARRGELAQAVRLRSESLQLMNVLGEPEKWSRPQHY